MAENNTRGPVNLGNNDPLRAVDDKRAPLAHNGDISHVDILLPDFTGLLEDEIHPRLE